MARPEVGRRTTAPQAESLPPKKKKKPAPVVLVPNAEAYSIPEFCEAHRISESMYYKIRGLGLGPERDARSYENHHHKRKRRRLAPRSNDRNRSSININKRPTITSMAGRSD